MKFNNIVSRIIWIEILLIAMFISYQPVPDKIVINHDPRIGGLTKFMSDHHFAQPYYVKEYIRAADKNKLDYKILPTVAILESSGCIHFIKNNCFGWNSARSGFRSIPEGISFVTGQLASGKYYAGKSLEQKIKTYNSENHNYWNNFLKLYNELP